jgi:hypothetical protein
MWLFMAYLPPNVHLCLEHVLGRYASFSSHLSEDREAIGVEWGPAVAFAFAFRSWSRFPKSLLPVPIPNPCFLYQGLASAMPKTALPSFEKSSLRRSRDQTLLPCALLSRSLGFRIPPVEKTENSPRWNPGNTNQFSRKCALACLRPFEEERMADENPK